MWSRGPVSFLSISICALALLMWSGASSPHRAMAAGETVIAIDGPTADAVSLHGWPGGATVTVDVLSGPGGPSLLLPLPGPLSVLVDGSGFGSVALPIALEPGQVVQASLALVIKDVTIVALTVQADATADVISGVAPAGDPVGVEVCNPVCIAVPGAIADAAGRFIVSTGSLPPLSGDIQLGTTFSAAITDADGDGQRVESGVSPTVSAVFRGAFPAGRLC